MKRAIALILMLAMVTALALSGGSIEQRCDRAHGLGAGSAHGLQRAPDALAGAAELLRGGVEHPVHGRDRPGELLQLALRQLPRGVGDALPHDAAHVAPSLDGAAKAAVVHKAAVFPRDAAHIVAGIGIADAARGAAEADRAGVFARDAADVADVHEILLGEGGEIKTALAAGRDCHGVDVAFVFTVEHNTRVRPRNAADLVLAGDGAFKAAACHRAGVFPGHAADVLHAAQLAGKAAAADRALVKAGKAADLALGAGGQHAARNVQIVYAALEDNLKDYRQTVNSTTTFLISQIFIIDEVQNFDPLYLELCYLLLETGNDTTFLMAGDLNQSVRAQSRRGDVPWKRINGVKLDFKGRVKYIEKNYRNSCEISAYIYRMLNLMNNRFSMLGMINSLEYEYNSFTMGEKPTIALKVKTGIDRMRIKQEIIAAIKEITEQYKVSYSDISILFPVRQRAFLRYNFLYWLEDALKNAGIPYSMIIDSDNNPNGRKKYSQTSGIVVSTIESSLGLDFKTVILAGLLPYNYVFPQGKSAKEIKSWKVVKAMTEEEQNLVQSQMRSIYTACSRARDILYVISDLKAGSPMEEILNKGTGKITVPKTKEILPKRTDDAGVKEKSPKSSTTSLSKKKPILVKDHVVIKAVIKETKVDTSFIINLAEYPQQKKIIGKKVGDSFVFGRNNYTYEIVEIVDY